MYKNEEQNKEKQKKLMIKKIEEDILRSVPKYAASREMNLSGPIFFIHEKDDEFYISEFYGSEMVIFKSIEEVRSFIEEVVAEFDGSLKYDMTVYRDSNLHKASIRFEYEYKES